MIAFSETNKALEEDIDEKKLEIINLKKNR